MPSFYTQVDENTFDSSSNTAGPWSSEAQHGGPPSALLTRQIERYKPREGHRLSRIAVDILRPVPVGRLFTQVTSVQRGRRVELLEATASSGLDRKNSDPVLIGRAWRVESVATDVPERRIGGASRHDTIEPATPIPQAPGFRTDGYLAAIDWSFGRGAFEEYGPAEAWARPKLPLLAGEPMSAWQRVMTVADSGSGISMAFSSDEYPAINTDLIVVLDRDPQGDWIGMDSLTTVAPGGGATARTDILDHSGRIGLATQTLLVGRRPR